MMAFAGLQVGLASPSRITFVVVVMAFATVVSQTDASEKDEQFERHVRPLLIQRCHKGRNRGSSMWWWWGRVGFVLG